MPNLEELHNRLTELLQDGKPNGLNRFTIELIGDIQPFLTKEYGRSFPPIQWDLSYGEGYRQKLRDLGVREDQIGGIANFIGSRFGGNIVIDLEFTRQRLINGHTNDAMVNLVGTIIEESMHALFPDIMDKEMVHIRIGLVERFLGLKFTEEDKKIMIDSVTEEPNHGFL